MGQLVRLTITLEKLREAGEAAARGVRWAEGPDEAARALRASGWRAPSRPGMKGIELPAGFERAPSHMGPPGEAVVIIWHHSESWRAGVEASWCLAVHPSGNKPAVAMRIELPGRGGLPLQAEVRPTGRPSGEAARTSPKRGRAHRGEASAVPVVVVDPTWSDGRLRDSVMAQLVEGCVRPGTGIPGRRDAVVELASDALAWWSRWANPGKGQDEAARLSAAYEVAERSPSPSTPAGHRAYLTKSLKRGWSQAYRGMVTPELGPSGFRLVREDERVRSPAELNEATRILGIARSTAYARLHRGGRTVQEFLQGPDALDALVDFLSAQAPARIPERSIVILATLRAAGMKENSARRLERRTRDLAPQERLRRIEGALGRIPPSRRPARRRRGR
jgi:hypothetical protein